MLTKRPFLAPKKFQEEAEAKIRFTERERKLTTVKGKIERIIMEMTGEM